MKTQRRGGFASILMLAVVGIGLSAGLVTLSRIQASSDPLFGIQKLLTQPGSKMLVRLPISNSLAQVANSNSEQTSIADSYPNSPQSSVGILRPSLVFVVNNPLDG